MSPDRWKITCAPGSDRIEAVYWRGLGRATRKPLLRMKSSVASSMRPLLGSARRSFSEVMSGGPILSRCRQLAGLGSSTSEGLLHEVADDMRGGDVRLLDARRVAGGDAQAVVHQVFQFSAAGAGEADRRQPPLTGGLDRCDDVSRVAAGAERPQHICSTAQRLHLPREDALKTVIVALRREEGHVGPERDGG